MPSPGRLPSPRGDAKPSAMTDMPPFAPTLATPAAPPPAKRLGGAMSAAMVIGTMIGSGIYLLPTTLAPFGFNIVLAFAITIAGTMCLAIALAKLAGRLPGGPFVYVSTAFGDTAAFVTMWSCELRSRGPLIRAAGAA